MADKECMECGAFVEAGEFHDYIECVRYRWSSVDCEPGQLSPHQLKQDMLAILNELGRVRSVNGGKSDG